MSGHEERPPPADTARPHSAGIFDYWLGGSDHYEIDRRTGEQVLAAFPRMSELARISRQFAGRVVRHLVTREGVRQFLDVGAGLPTAGNTHEVAQQIAPEARIVYADHDPLVLAHADALLACSPQGAADYIHADAREPRRILTSASRTLDMEQPVAVMLMGLLAHIDSHAEARSIVRKLMEDLPAGSFLAIRDGTDTDEAYRRAVREYNRCGAVPYRLRSPARIAAFFDGLEPVEPGLVPCPLWRPPDGAGTGAGAKAPVLGGLGKKSG